MFIDLLTLEKYISASSSDAEGDCTFIVKRSEVHGAGVKMSAGLTGLNFVRNYYEAYRSFRFLTAKLNY